MAKDVTIYQKSTSYHYSSVDKIQTKGLDEESHIDWLPEDECITGYRKITKNGKYIASDEGLGGYTAVFVSVPAVGVYGVDPNGELYRVYVDPDGYLVKTIKSTGEPVPINSNYIAIPAQEYQGSGITEYSNSTVNVIGESAFASCVDLSRVDFPNVHTVKRDAFSGCVVLRDTVFPSLNTIDEGAFEDCESLISVSFSVCTYIGSNAFKNCTRLLSVDLSGSTMCILENKNAFEGTSAKIMVPSNLRSFYLKASEWSYFASRIRIYGTIEIAPSQYYNDLTITTFTDLSVTDIGENAFGFCENLSYVNFPIVSNIEPNAFTHCYKLKDINFPEVRTIGSEAFWACHNLRSVSFPKLEKFSGYAVLANCNLLSAVYLGGSRVVELQPVSSERTLYEGNFSYTPIRNSAILGYYGSIVVPASLVNAYKTNSTWSVLSSRISSTPPSIPYPSPAPYKELPEDPRTSTASYYASSDVTYIGNYTFSGNMNLTSVSFPACRQIGGFAFEGCYSLSSIYAPNVMEIEAGALMGCPLKSISFPKLVSVDDWTFLRTALTTVNLPMLETIGQNTFSGCLDLKMVSLPRLKTMTVGAFYECHALESVYFMGSSVVQIDWYGNNNFNFTPISDSSYLGGRYGSIYVPASLLTAYRTHSMWDIYADRFVGV